MWFIGVEVEQETSAPPPKKNPESAPEFSRENFCKITVPFIEDIRSFLLTYLLNCIF